MTVLAASSSGGFHTLSAPQQSLLAKWLSEHPSCRQATDLDCDCADEIQQMRRGWDGTDWPAVPDYHPYQVVGDFNGDGFLDFAVVLVDTTRTADQFILAVFNGPFRDRDITPAFLEKQLDLKYRGLFFGPPRPRPYRLLVGPFESDNGILLLPAGKTYTWDTSRDHQ
jgi:hypothetical protein